MCMSSWNSKKCLLSVFVLFTFIFAWKLYNNRLEPESGNDDSLRQSFDQYDNELWQQKNSKLQELKNDKLLDDHYISEWDQSDPRLIDHIRRKYLHKPADRLTPYNLTTNKVDYSLYGASTIANESLGGLRNGFFVECGAYDGEEASNSLMSEMYLDWTGLLIEPEPGNFQRLLSRSRKSWLINGCIHGHSKPKPTVIYATQFASVLETYMDDSRRQFNIYATNNTIQSTKVWCFPLYSLLLALNRTSIDYFSLDVEGGELDILANLPFDKMSIKLLQIEVEWIKFGADETKRNQAAKLKEYMDIKHPEFKEIASTPMDIFYMS